MKQTPDIKAPLFHIPERYFETLEKRMETRIASTDHLYRSRTTTLKRNFLYTISAAAAICALILGTYFWRSDSGEKTQSTAQASTTIDAQLLDLTQILIYMTDDTTFPAGQPLIAKNSLQAPEIPEKAEDLLRQSDLNLVYSDQNIAYAVAPDAAQQYIEDNYNILELATL